MRKSITPIYLIIAVLMTSVPQASAQSWLDYEQVLERYPLLHTGNAASLVTYAPSDSSQLLLGEARLTASTGQGHFKPLHIAPHTWQTRAQVRSIYRMSRRVVVRGVMGYSYGWGTDAGGSVWIDPEHMPFDITETSDSTRGDVSLETYWLNGEVGVDVGHGFGLGAHFGYKTGSGAKKKDPRHTNSLMSADVSLGAIWQRSGLTLGACYQFRRTTEALKFSTVGRTDQIYHYLIDHGAMFGRQETTDGNGYTGSSNERPLLDLRHGVNIQVAYGYGTTHLGLEGGWMHRHGHYGLESPSMIDYNRHRGDEWNLGAWWQHEGRTTLQRVTVDWHHQSLDDHERTYRIITDHGVTDVNYYDDRLMGTRSDDAIGVNADLQWGVRRLLPTWQVLAGVTHHRRSVTASVFPYYRQQRTRLTEMSLQGSRHWIMENDHVWSLTLQGGWATGGGTAAHDGVYQVPSPDASKPAEHTIYLMRQYEYLTADRLLAGARLGWSLPIVRRQARLYLEAEYRYCQAFDITHLEGGCRHTAALSIGCRF